MINIVTVISDDIDGKFVRLLSANSYAVLPAIGYRNRLRKNGNNYVHASFMKQLDSLNKIHCVPFILNSYYHFFVVFCVHINNTTRTVYGEDTAKTACETFVNLKSGRFCVWDCGQIVKNAWTEGVCVLWDTTGLILWPFRLWNNWRLPVCLWNMRTWVTTRCEKSQRS